MWSSEVNSCEEKGGGERIPRVLLTDGVRGNILCFEKKDEKSVLAYNCNWPKFHEVFFIRWYRNTQMNFLPNSYRVYKVLGLQRYPLKSIYRLQNKEVEPTQSLRVTSLQVYLLHCFRGCIWPLPPLTGVQLIHSAVLVSDIYEIDN